jgi:hypothetical protein
LRRILSSFCPLKASAPFLKYFPNIFDFNISDLEMTDEKVSFVTKASLRETASKLQT